MRSYNDCNVLVLRHEDTLKAGWNKNRHIKEDPYNEEDWDDEPDKIDTLSPFNYDTIHEIHKADIVMYVDKRGEARIIKNRFA